MSGIVGILNFDGKPVEYKLLQRLTQLMTYRGLDEQNCWIKGSVGFGHSLLRTTVEANHESQPMSLDSQTWITADARIDGRRELMNKLGITELVQKKQMTDSSLILRAYHHWGEDCLEHLIGDFAFAIWDASQQHLFCARDQLGVKPFYYAFLGNCFVFSNTLICIRWHPQVSPQLNEEAIADFLLFERNCNLKTTTFKDIQRLQAAHTLRVHNGTVTSQGYWTLPVPERIFYRDRKEYGAHFRELMSVAVGDRLRTENVGILLSGGLDSTTITATALATAENNSQSLNLQGFTTLYEQLIQDPEPEYTRLVANHLGISLHPLVADSYYPYQNWEQPQLSTPDPVHEPLAQIFLEQLKRLNRHSRVALCGHGGDESLCPSSVSYLFNKMPVGTLLMDIIRCLFVHHLFPPWGTGYLAQIRGWCTSNTQSTAFPPWINPDFSKRLHLQERWQERQDKNSTIPPHASRAYKSLLSPLWDSLFESHDPGISGIPVEIRLPFLDLRLVNYLLALPPIPWCVDKQILRVAMKHQLPEEICQRKKTPVIGNPIQGHLRQGLQPWKSLKTVPEVEEYININSILSKVMEYRKEEWLAWESLRTVSLGYWLKHLNSDLFDKVNLAY